jgi:23S rRNA (uracil1939-C5)-methyltransferase
MVQPPTAAAPIGRIGDRFELEISDLGHDGQGVGRWQERVVFVPGALPEERVAVVVRRVQKRHLEAELQAVLQPSPLRRRPPCILAERCGGCSLQHWQDDPQARWKEQVVVQALRRIGGLECSVDPLLLPQTSLGYRNRATIPLERREGDGQLRAGYYRRGSHRIVNLNRCPVLDPRIDALIAPSRPTLRPATGPLTGTWSTGEACAIWPFAWATTAARS